MLTRDIRRHVPLGESGQELEASLAVQFGEQYMGNACLLPKLVEQNEDRFISEAIAVRDIWAVNHRGFWVGVVGLIIVGGQLRLAKAANHSPTKGIQRNCGEMGAEAQAHMFDEGMMLGDVALKWLFVAGPSDRCLIESSCGRPARTLPPCDECRPLLMESPYTTPDMPITMIAAPIGGGPRMEIERRTLGEIDAQYANVVPPPSSSAMLARC